MVFKIRRESPEERRDRLDREQAESAEFDARRQALITERSAQVRQLAALYDRLTPWEQGVLRTLVAHAENFEICGTQGARLAILSDGQLTSLERMVTKYLAPQTLAAQMEAARRPSSFAQMCARPRPRG